MQAPDLLKAHNKGYTKKNGTFVAPFDDKRASAHPGEKKPPAKWSAGGQPSLFGRSGWPSGVGKLTSSSAKKPEPKAIHPKKGDHGEAVGIMSPSAPTDASTWTDPTAVATFVPDGDVPLSLHGVSFAPWRDHPRTDDGWDYVDGQMDDLEEPPMKLPVGKTASSGVVIEEPDGRVWIVHPTNKFAGYQATFPKGGAEDGMSLQANAIKECFEEAGLKVEITGLLGDFERSTSVARYYHAKRVGGTPVGMGWESQAVSLAPKGKMLGLLNSNVDHPIAVALGANYDKSQGEPMDGWAKVGEQKGSNPGGTFADERGVRWYCKFPKSTDHAKNEVLAAKLYEACGVLVPDLKLVRKGGKVGVASRMVDGLKSDAFKVSSAAGAREGFAVDAWLANWDVVGLGYDNLLIDKDGAACRVDTGGALLYRAQGAKKPFGDTVGEIESLRSPDMNAQADAVFGDMTDAQIAQSATMVTGLPDATIKELVHEFGPGDDADREKLFHTLVARKMDLAKRFGPK
jgi:ADP-ribose pyrophosphatase YjhB (NUDIX family)